MHTNQYHIFGDAATFVQLNVTTDKRLVVLRWSFSIFLTSTHLYCSWYIEYIYDINHKVILTHCFIVWATYYNIIDIYISCNTHGSDGSIKQAYRGAISIEWDQCRKVVKGKTPSTLGVWNCKV